jgi:glucose/mannose transport system substrate-binding protein
VVLSVMGVDGYKKALVDLDNGALTGPEMVKALTELKKVATYMDADGKGQDWNLEAAKVINGKAGMQIMGDWAKSEWTAAKKVAGKDYECVAFPGTDKAFTYNIDSLAVFKQKDKGTAAGQQDIAKVVLGENFQKVFSINKGSIPVRNDMLPTWASRFRLLRPDRGQGLPGRRQDRRPAAEHGAQHGHHAGGAGAFFDVVTNYINDPKADPADAAKKLGAAIKSAK